MTHTWINCIGLHINDPMNSFKSSFRIYDGQARAYVKEEEDRVIIESSCWLSQAWLWCFWALRRSFKIYVR